MANPRWRRYLRLLGIEIKADVEDELRFHLEAKREELLARGLSERAAAAEAARRFGDVVEVRRMCVEMERGRVRRMEWKERLGNWRQDAKFALRQLRRNPGFAATAILSLALGIGANTAIFTLTDQILLRLLPVERPRELVQLRVDGGHVGSQSGDGVHTFSHPMYLALRDRNSVFSGLTGQMLSNASLTVDGRNELVGVAMVAGNFFDVFGLKAYQGRMLAAADDQVKSGSPVAVLRYDFWRSQFNGSPAVIGSTIRLNGYPFTVVGIAPPGFAGTDIGFPTNVWIPVTMKPALQPTDSPLEDERYAWFSLFGRLKPGVSREQAEAALKVVYRRRQMEELNSSYFQINPQARDRFLKQIFRLEPAAHGQSTLRERFEQPLVLLQALVAAVLLIACCNIAGLLLARGASRQRELAIRGALGAGRGRLVQQMVVENLLLGLGSGAAGILISGWATRALVHLVAADPSRISLATAPDVRILLFATVLTFATTMIFGLLPAWQSSRPVVDVLKQSSGAIAGGRSQARLRKLFVAFQVGLSTLLLIGAGLFARTLGNLRAIDLGFKTEGLATFSVLPATEYDDARKLRVYREVLDAVASLPGVKAVGANTARLLTGGRSDGPIHLPGIDSRGGDATNSFFNNITPGYFTALGIPIIAGRDLSWRDWGSGRQYALVNETLVNRYFEGRNPVGSMLGRGGSDAALSFEIVGVFGNARYHDPRGSIPRQTFFAMDSRIRFAGAIHVYARIEGDAATLLPQMRDRVRQVDSNLIVVNLGTVGRQLDLLLANERMLASLSIAFALLAVLLAVTGLYGVLSFMVARRNREIGIRMALGARRGRMIGLVLGEMAAVIVFGITAGIVAGALCGRFVESQLYGVKPSDASVFVSSVAILFLCSLAAAVLPAWRASTLDPTKVLRQD